MQTSLQRSPLAVWPRTLTILAAAAAIWLLLSANSETGFSGTAGWAVNTTCENEADVLRASDLSRNGISVSCNMDTISSLRAAP